MLNDSNCNSENVHDKPKNIKQFWNIAHYQRKKYMIAIDYALKKKNG